VWHDVECGGFAADLGLWEEIAANAGDPVLDLGCGTGRVALHLARHGHEVHGLDLEPALTEELARRGAETGVAVTAHAGDARDFALTETLSPTGLQTATGFGAVLAPMQLLQLFRDSSERISCMRCARRHLRSGGLFATAIVDGFPDELVEEAPPPLPDTREIDGWLYSSLPLDATLEEGTIAVRRLRHTVSPGGELRDELDEIPLRLLEATTIEAEAREAGLEPFERREIPPTEIHVGSTVILAMAGA
jgi:SAM-dependent methyltransferase